MASSTASRSIVTQDAIVAAGCAPDIGAASPSRLADFVELTKARLVTMVLVTTAVGFLIGDTQTTSASIHWGALVLTLLGAGLAAGSAMALNQFLEIAPDGLMHRTRERPLPAGRVSSSSALVSAALMGLVGTALLLVAVHPLAAILAGLNILLYAFVYTPLKRKTSLNTLVGAITGGIPPMIGWAAATGTLGRGAWLLGAILFVWQIPHFLALAWLHREDYRRGGFVMLPLVDRDGALTARVVVLSTLALTPLSLMAVQGRLAGPVFALVAIVLGLAFAAIAARLIWDRSDRAARRVFLTSLVYLPLLLGALVLDHMALA